MACILIIDKRQRLTLDAFDDSRLCEAEDMHFGGCSFTVQEGLEGLLDPEGDGEKGSWIVLQRQDSASTERPRPPKLRLGFRWVPLGPQQVSIPGTDTARKAKETLEEYPEIDHTTPHAGILALRIGSVSGVNTSAGCLCISVKINNKCPQKSRYSDSRSAADSARTRLPARERRIIKRLQNQGWEAQSVADLLERPVEVVKDEFDPVAAAASAASERETSKRKHDSVHINDMLYLPVFHSDGSEDPGQQPVDLEVLNTDGVCIGWTSENLRLLLTAPQTRWMNLSGTTLASAMSVQVGALFRPCVSKLTKGS